MSSNSKARGHRLLPYVWWLLVATFSLSMWSNVFMTFRGGVHAALSLPTLVGMSVVLGQCAVLAALSASNVVEGAKSLITQSGTSRRALVALSGRAFVVGAIVLSPFVAVTLNVGNGWPTAFSFAGAQQLEESGLQPSFENPADEADYVRYKSGDSSVSGALSARVDLQHDRGIAAIVTTTGFAFGVFFWCSFIGALVLKFRGTAIRIGVALSGALVVALLVVPMWFVSARAASYSGDRDLLYIACWRHPALVLGVGVMFCAAMLGWALLVWGTVDAHTMKSPSPQPR